MVKSNDPSNTEWHVRITSVPINPIVDHYEGDCLKEMIDISVINDQTSYECAT